MFNLLIRVYRALQAAANDRTVLLRISPRHKNKTIALFNVMTALFNLKTNLLLMTATVCCYADLTFAMTFFVSGCVAVRKTKFR